MLINKRTNPTDIPTSSFVPGNSTKTPQTQVQVDQKKKQPANVRKVLYARKSLKDWLEELVSLPLTSGERDTVSDDSAERTCPALHDRSRFSTYRPAQEDLFIMRVYWGLSVSEMCGVELRSDLSGHTGERWRVWSGWISIRKDR